MPGAPTRRRGGPGRSRGRDCHLETTAPSAVRCIAREWSPQGERAIGLAHFGIDRGCYGVREAQEAIMLRMNGKPGAATGTRWRGAIDRSTRVAGLSLIGLWMSLRWGVGAVSALPIGYFALGDSVAAGHGLADDGTTCHRSMLAYPWGLFGRLQETFVVQQFDLLACSGTTTGTLDRQVSEVLSRLSAHPTLLTLTVGANDFGWSDVFALARHLCTPDDKAFHAWVEGTAQTVEDNLVGQLSRLRAYPQVEVILTDYYNPTNASGAFWKRVHPECLFVDVYDRSAEVVNALN